jgi:UDP-N-acetylmuramoyl-tripeptide--D-alanyl-D-alanine ligase
MGASHIGEIRTLCLIARPDYGIITNVGTAHLQGFGNVDDVIKAKTELYEHLRKINGIALYDDKNPILSEKIFRIINRAVPFSDPTGIELIVERIPSDLFLILKAVYHNTTYTISTHLFGEYNLENARAAIAAGLFFDVDMKDIVAAVENYEPANNRSQIKVTKNNTLICDSYNANPTSMSLALRSFTGIQSAHKLVIMGDMLELGEKSEAEHLKLIDELQFRHFENALLVGPVFQKISSKSGFKSFSDVSKLMEYLNNNTIKGNLILIKGSRGIGLEKIYSLL